MTDQTPHRPRPGPRHGRTNQPISIVFGDGIGPEVMQASLRILLAAGARIAVEPVDLSGRPGDAEEDHARLLSAARQSLRRTGVLYRAPVTTPPAGVACPVQVLSRDADLFATTRPCRAMAPAIATRHPAMDLIIVHDLPGAARGDARQMRAERLLHHAFAVARRQGLRRLDAFVEHPDALTAELFDAVAGHYPDIAAGRRRLETGLAGLVGRPNGFGVVVVPGRHGDLVATLAARLAGGVGLAPSAALGTDCAMFSTVHGTAPQLAGRDRANPSAMLLAGVMMLHHIGQHRVAECVHDAWLATIEDGIHTADMVNPGTTRLRPGTRGFADAVITRLGQAPRMLRPAAAASPRHNQNIMMQA
ncbi:isocitrate/isopropylmalate family dehydrogenase [Tistrella mobilis]|uniref:isocitrate/isopropylmalate family dehydrogenase n=1 Tax=Tistrella mobilis TaxID=171437 RepID=UPI0035565DF4